EAEKGRIGAAANAAGASANRPDLQFRIDRFEVAGGRFGWINEGATPAYLTQANLVLENLSNHFTDGAARMKLGARFMGSGEMAATGAFRSDLDGPDFDLNVKIVDADMRAMNDLLRAQAKLDVESGLLSVYSEIGVKSHRINGWVKPLFRDVQVY